MDKSTNCINGLKLTWLLISLNYYEEQNTFTGGSGLLSVCWTRYISKDFDVYLALHERTIELPNATCLKADLNSYESILQVLKQINLIL